MSDELQPVLHVDLGEVYDDASAKGATQPTVVNDERYQREPLAWMIDVLGIRRNTLVWSENPSYGSHRWDGTPDPLVAILDGLANGEDVGVESGSGTGKTFLAAATVLWFLSCWEDSIVVTVAPKEAQLVLMLHKELARLWPRFAVRHPQAELSRLRIRMRPESDIWGAVGFSVGVDAAEISATKAQGFHAPHALYIFEETPGIHSAVMTAFEMTASAPHNPRLALGNPDNQTDTLHTFCVTPGVRHIRISALDHPNVVANDASIVPGAVSLKKVTERANKYGSDSPLYLSRVRGVSPAEASDSLIKLQWCRGAIALSEEPSLRQGPPALGVDVANSAAGDRAAIARFQGATLVEVSSFACPDSNLLGARVAAEMRVLGVTDRHVGVDSVGVGAGCINELKRLGRNVQALNGGSAAPSVRGQEELFLNLRSAIWWKLRDDLSHGRLALPDDEELIGDLTVPTWSTRNGKIVIESKEDLKKRLGRSPDKGDAVAYGNWARTTHGVSAAMWKSLAEHVSAGESEASLMLREMEGGSRPRSTIDVTGGRY